MARRRIGVDTIYAPGTTTCEANARIIKTSLKEMKAAKITTMAQEEAQPVIEVRTVPEIGIIIILKKKKK